jgi:transcriptional regulator with XRE-family HTH domain/tetratricopeptide (TPR) repeat protein
VARTGFGDRLRELRASAGLTIEALAEASGVSVRAISDTERGRSRAPQPRTVAALAAGLGLGPADADAFTALARAGRSPAPAGRPRACELPRRSAHFVGRDAEVAALGARIAATVPVVAVLHGPPGVGKTALAIRVAELHRDRFPDGSYYLDLRGTDPEPMAAAEVQAALLKALGVSSRQIARDHDERAGQLRALLTHRRCLVILDNAGSEPQVRGLLPGAGASCVLVTSRRALGGLEAVTRHGLAPLRPEESAALLHTVGGPDASAARRAAEVDTLARLCGHLPLALTIAGTRLAGRPMSHLIAELSDAERRLATLTSQDNGVEAAFSVSYTRLAEPVRTVFRRLAHVPTVSFSAAAAAVLAGRDLVETEDHLEELLDLGLLQPEGGDRYRLHDLIRLYAADRLRAEEPVPLRAATERRMVDWYLDTAIAAGRWFEPGYGAAPADWRYPVPLDTPEQAQAWLQAEFDGWLDAMRRAFRAGAHQRVVDVAESLHWYSDRTYTVDPWPVVYGLSRDAAVRLPDRRQEAVQLNYLAWAVSHCDGRHEEGVGLAMDAHRLAEELGDRREQAYALRYAGNSLRVLGRHDEALDLIERSFVLADAAGDHDGHVQALVAAGLALLALRRADDAVDHFRRTLAEVDRRPLAPAPAQIARLTAWLYLSAALADSHRWAEALDAALTALPLAREFGEPSLTGQAHKMLGAAYVGLGDTARARAELTTARRLLRKRTFGSGVLREVEALLARLGPAVKSA